MTDVKLPNWVRAEGKTLQFYKAILEDAHHNRGYAHQYTSPFTRIEKGKVVKLDAQYFVRESSSNTDSESLYAGPGWIAMIWSLVGDEANAQVTVVAESAELAREIAGHALKDVTHEVPEGKLALGFWMLGSLGPVRMGRDVEVPTWQEIKGNYPKQAASALDNLMGMRPEDVYGKMVLLYGPPGTGKTHIIQALAKEWNDWCVTDCVMDPELMFSSATYLNTLLVEPSNKKYRLVIIEDCDELIRGTAKQATGQALARLLNTTDGLLAQASNTIFLITTNEDISVMHPAVTRPGRCLAQIEVGKLSEEEAQGWLDTSAGMPGVRVQSSTLAELYALRANLGPLKVSEKPEASPTGMYI